MSEGLEHHYFDKLEKDVFQLVDGLREAENELPQITRMR